jgi:HPt (histidine-containing phosphotransfer) domain-containing protein
LEFYAKVFELPNFQTIVTQSVVDKKAKNKHQQLISDAQILDIKTVNELRKYASTEDLLDIYKEFEKDTTLAFQELKSQFNEQKINEILFILHKVKGNAASLGSSSVALLCEQLELKLKLAETSNVEQDFEQLISLFDNFVSNYIRILNQH